MTVIAIDCGGTRLRAARVEEHGRLTDVTERPTPRRAEELPQAIIAACDTAGPADAVGVAIAGLVDHAGGRLVWMPHLGGGTPLAEPVSSAVGLPVVVDNDANAACIAEASLGAGRGYRMVLTVTVGTGIGAGLVIDGRIERGRGFLGEVGHLVVDPRGPECGCGLSGCWETVASGRALDRAARRLAADDPGGGVAVVAESEEAAGIHLTSAASAGDAAAAAALEEVASRFGAGLAGLVAVLDPDVIVVGGGVGAIGDLFLEPTRRAAMSGLSSGHVRRPTPIVAAHFGPDAGLVGAGLLAGW